MITGLPASQIVDLNWGKDDWAVRAARHLRRPLANKRLLFMDLTPKGVEIRVRSLLHTTDISADHTIVISSNQRIRSRCNLIQSGS